MYQIMKYFMLIIFICELILGNAFAFYLQKGNLLKNSDIISFQEKKFLSNTAKSTILKKSNFIPERFEKKVIFNATQPEKTFNETSSIEKEFNKRAKIYGLKLKQFGYRFFERSNPIPLSVSVDKSYVLGPGDELFLYIIGQIPGLDLSEIPRLVVDKEGKIYIPGLGVFYVWGKTVAQAEKEISQALKTNIKLTVGRVRTFPVYVSGEVKSPGAVEVTALHTVVDALIMAGGVEKTGSLRHIILTRKIDGKVKRVEIDLYDLLLEGKPVDMRLKDGDVIFVPPIKKVVGIGGGVRRPAIYELRGGETLKDLIKMAGGISASTYKYKVVIQRYEENKELKVIEGSLDDPKFMSQPLKDGDLIVIQKIVPIPENFIEIKGEIKYPGVYAYKEGMKLSDILKPDLLKVDTNTKFAVIIRREIGKPPKYITFIPEDILEHKEDIALQPLDTIVFYKFGQVENFDFDKIKNAFIVEGEIKYPGVYAYKEGMKLSDILKPDLLLLNTNLYYAEIDRRDPKTLDIVKIIKFAPMDILTHKKDIKIKPLDVIQFYSKYVFAPIKVSGCIKNPGYIPYHKGIRLKDVLSDKEFCEDIKNLKVEVFRTAKKKKSITSLKETQKIKAKVENEKEIIEKHLFSVYLYDLLIAQKANANISLFPGDRVVVKKIKKDEIVEKVNIAGYVKKPGVYPIKENTTLYDVLKAAGGFRENAYPEGIVILRKSVAELQKKRISYAIIQMQKQLEKEEAGILQSDLKGEELKARQAAIEAKRRLLEMMKKTSVTGRIIGLIVPKDIEKLKNSPYNILLEDGDQIFIPKKPAEVLVFGEVYNPSALVYQPGMTVADYIKKAGGFTKYADIKDIFVIKANGEAYSLSEKKHFIFWDKKRKRFVLASGILSYVPQPGEAIIVPTKIKVPIMWRPLIKDIIQIIYQSALTVYTITNL